MSACSADAARESTGASAASGTAPAPATTPASSDGSGIYLVQEGSASTLAPVAGSAGEFTLTVSDAAPQTAYFGDVTTRTAGLGPNAVLLADMFESKLPPTRAADPNQTHNAALDWEAGSARGTLIVTLLAGSYDAAAATLTYRVKLLDEVDPSSPLATARPDASPSAGTDPNSLPPGITRSALFIDPVDEMGVTQCNVTIKNMTSQDLTVSQTQHSEGWDSVITTGLVIGADPVWGGGVSPNPDSMVFVSEMEWHECWTNATLTTSGGGTISINAGDPVWDPTHGDCSASAGLFCVVEAPPLGQPANINFTICQVTEGLPNCSA